MGSIAQLSESSREGALAEKFLAAERGVVLLRLLIIVVGGLSYPWLEGLTGKGPRFAYGVLVLAMAYALFLYWWEPYRRYRAALLASVTSAIDFGFVMAWQYATGGVHTHYFTIICLTVVVIGIRYTPRATVLSTLLISGCYLAMLALMGQLMEHPGLVLLNLGLILMAGLLGLICSRMVLEQLVARIELQKRLQMEEQLKGSEAALAEAQAIAHMGSWNWELSSDLHTWSAELYRILGRAPGEASHAALLKSMHPEERTPFEQELHQVLAGRPSLHGEYRLLQASGEVRWIHIWGRVVRDGSGRPVRLSGTAQDITERKVLEMRLAVADRMAALGTLAGGVAHEINNPLTFITNNLLYLEENLGTQAAAQLPHHEELRKALADAREGANRVRTIVKDLRTFSRVEDARRVPVDVHQGLDFAINMAAPELRPRARLVRDYGPVPPVLGDETRLGQVFLNLLVNAAQAIPEGNPEAHSVTVRTRVGASGQVEVEIRDTGSGMKPEVLARIFEPFFTTKPVGVGTGLGLSICHGIIVALGGRISAWSEVGQGTAFTVTLPATEAPPAVPEERTPAPSRGARARVLLIDDEPLVASSIRRTLKDSYDITMLLGMEALQRLLGGETFDAIVCDLAMPDITGMELHDRLREHRPDMAARMIFLTGGAFTPRAQAFIGQARYWLEKPVELPALRTLLQDVIEETRPPPDAP
ncbi:PAS domain S-box-containing protein [Stigmatella aurantiaca]|uniref:histidine kinase n=1 Tax=Stigmatella aurantiaca TaxID=41 RepID=A0A1H7XRD8_STIAU|nr:ATP-binding protein [Stigmatella aurantiaca]SEM36194.1 PAS domain S-box-containing protein [Stigmatella aurantiaca]